MVTVFTLAKEKSPIGRKVVRLKSD